MNRTFVLRSDVYTQAVIAFIQSNAPAMAAKGTPLAVTVTEAKSKRSGDQNKRYWALLQEIATNGWVEGKQFSADAWHEHMKRTFIGCEEVPKGGTVGISTTTLSVGEFTDYMEKVQAYAAEYLAVEFG